MLITALLQLFSLSWQAELEPGMIIFAWGFPLFLSKILVGKKSSFLVKIQNHDMTISFEKTFIPSTRTIKNTNKKRKIMKSGVMKLLQMPVAALIKRTDDSYLLKWRTPPWIASWFRERVPPWGPIEKTSLVTAPASREPKSHGVACSPYPPGQDLLTNPPRLPLVVSPSGKVPPAAKACFLAAFFRHLKPTLKERGSWMNNSGNRGNKTPDLEGRG